MQKRLYVGRYFPENSRTSYFVLIDLAAGYRTPYDSIKGLRNSVSHKLAEDHPYLFGEHHDYFPPGSVTYKLPEEIDVDRERYHELTPREREELERNISRRIRNASIGIEAERIRERVNGREGD